MHKGRPKANKTELARPWFQGNPAQPDHSSKKPRPPEYIAHNGATDHLRKHTSLKNANMAAAPHITHTHASPANALKTAAPQSTRTDTSSATPEKIHRHRSLTQTLPLQAVPDTDTSSANTGVTAALQITHTDTSPANAPKIAAPQITHRHHVCKRRKNCGGQARSRKHFLCKGQRKVWRHRTLTPTFFGNRPSKCGASNHPHRPRCLFKPSDPYMPVQQIKTANDALQQTLKHKRGTPSPNCHLPVQGFIFDPHRFRLFF